VLGPVFILKSTFMTPLVERRDAPERRLVAEMWLFPDGTRVLEISLKCLPTEAFQVAAEARAYLARLGIDITGEQQTKTRKALSTSARSPRTSCPPRERPYPRSWSPRHRSGG
jgi:hypothetical protein